MSDDGDELKRLFGYRTGSVQIYIRIGWKQTLRRQYAHENALRFIGIMILSHDLEEVFVHGEVQGTKVSDEAKGRKHQQRKPPRPP